MKKLLICMAVALAALLLCMSAMAEEIVFCEHCGAEITGTHWSADGESHWLECGECGGQGVSGRRT